MMFQQCIHIFSLFLIFFLGVGAQGGGGGGRGGGGGGVKGGREVGSEGGGR